MFISGEDDEFLNRSFLPKKGKALLTSVVEGMHLTGHHELHFLAGGGHDVPKVKGGKTACAAAATTTVKLISAFCSR